MTAILAEMVQRKMGKAEVRYAPLNQARINHFRCTRLIIRVPPIIVNPPDISIL